MFRYVIERFVSDFAQLNCGHFVNTTSNWTICAGCLAEAEQQAELGRDGFTEVAELREMRASI